LTWGIDENRFSTPSKTFSNYDLQFNDDTLEETGTSSKEVAT